MAGREVKLDYKGKKKAINGRYYITSKNSGHTLMLKDVSYLWKIVRPVIRPFR